MLSLLHIENIAVIQNADIEFNRGFTVLSGETGAGKSIVIDAIGAILGQRTSRDLIRNGAPKGFVSAVFTEIPLELRNILEGMELNGDENDTVHIQRQISADGKSVCRINMRPVSASVLKRISPYLVNIHGQHDGQKLMDEQCHVQFLDEFGNIAPLLEEYLPLYRQLSALKQQITELEKSEQERLQRIDMLRYHANEIAEAQLIPDEYESLRERKAVFDNAQKLASSLDNAYRSLDGVESESLGVCALLSVASDSLQDISDVSGDLQSIYERMEELKYLALDLRDSLSFEKSRIDFSTEERARVEERLDLIYRLQQKYGETIPDILNYHSIITQELERLSCADETRQQLREEYKKLLSHARETAGRLSEARKRAAKQLEIKILTELSDLDMERSRFEVRVETGTKLTTHGMDTVTFLVSTNPGEPIKRLAKVASGGELSRIMLAMKNVLASVDSVGTLIFDEIDTGVSGRAAQKIAKKLACIAVQKQTLCVTHLPQIAAMGDEHLLISKSVQKNQSYTEVTLLSPEKRISEIARMISGDKITDITCRSAKELVDAAAEIKRRA